MIVTYSKSDPYPWGAFGNSASPKLPCAQNKNEKIAASKLWKPGYGPAVSCIAESLKALF